MVANVWGVGGWLNEGENVTLKISFSSESVWCSFWGITVHSTFYYADIFFISFKYDLKSGFQRSRVFNRLVKICETSNHHIVSFSLNIAHIEDYCDVFAFWHNDQYITYLLFTPLSFQNYHLFRLRYKLALFWWCIDFGSWCKSLSLCLAFSRIHGTELGHFANCFPVCRSH